MHPLPVLLILIARLGSAAEFSSPSAAREMLGQAREAAAGQAQVPGSALRPEVGSYYFLKRMGYPEELEREELQRLLQEFVDAVHGRGFRWLGDAKDFDHGHFLYAPEKWDRPVAILYHTQEQASRLSQEEPGGPYDYLDRGGRNWIQFLDGKGGIVNAREFERRTYPEDSRWDRYRVRSSTVSPYTIHYPMLDHERLGIDPDYFINKNRGPAKPSHFMFRFARVPCADLPATLPADAAVVYIDLPARPGEPGRERACLLLDN